MSASRRIRSRLDIPPRNHFSGWRKGEMSPSLSLSLSEIAHAVVAHRLLRDCGLVIATGGGTSKLITKTKPLGAVPTQAVSLLPVSNDDTAGRSSMPYGIGAALQRCSQSHKRRLDIKSSVLMLLSAPSMGLALVIVLCHINFRLKVFRILGLMSARGMDLSSRSSCNGPRSSKRPFPQKPGEPLSYHAAFFTDSASACLLAILLEEV
ncbi:hypothetical protein ACVWWI_006471 [Bradyrhizobium sp. USDA 3686]|nr:hypothetical protein [Bradyrhizobium canariense]